MALPAIAGAVLSILGWIGIDLGISWLTGDGSTQVEYVRGLDFPTFLELYWLPLAILSTVAVCAAWMAVPGGSNDGRGRRDNGRTR